VQVGTRKRAATVLALGTVVALMMAYLVWNVARQQPLPLNSGGAGQGDLLVVELVDGENRVEALNSGDPGGPRSATGERCQRVYRAAGTTVCLQLAGLGPSFDAVVTGPDGTVLRKVALAGTPNRARVSPSGHIVSWTTFVTGDSYLIPGGFSTRTGVLDLRTGEVVDSLESFAVRVNGEPYLAQDRNFWGVTVADDDRTFYATLAGGGRTWLVRGDLVSGSAESVVSDAECPSLSPDGTRVAYKKRVGRFGPWDLAVLDLRSGGVLRLPGTVGIDDQAVWLTDDRLAYGSPATDGGRPSVYAVPADGSTPPHLLVADAMSPVPLG
jgi:hypothetical protein